MLGTIEERARSDPAAGAVALARRRPAEQPGRRLGPRRRHPDARRQRRHRPALHHQGRSRPRQVHRPARDQPRLGLVAEPRLSSAAAPSPRSANSPTPAAASSRSRSNSPRSSAACAGPRSRTTNRPKPRARAPTHPTTVTDDPATSPYPIWRPASAYAAGYKVVWQGQIYQAGWWNQGTPPGTAAADSPDGPWQPIGPVPRRQQGAAAGEDRHREPPGMVAERPSTTKATRSPSRTCPTGPAGTRRANSRWPNCPPTRAPPGNRSSNTPASRPRPKPPPPNRRRRKPPPNQAGAKH